MRQCEWCGAQMRPFQARIIVQGRKACERCRTGLKAMAALENPIHERTGKHPQEWYHGSPHEFEHFEDPAGRHDQGSEEETGRFGHWNALLGNHFTSDHEVAGDFAGGQHSSSGNINDDGPLNHVIHTRLHLKNPKVYDSEHDMDHEVYEYEHGENRNFHDNYAQPHHDDQDDDEWDEPDYAASNRRQFKGDSKVTYSKDDADESVPYGFHPKATGWLSAHPDKEGIARRYKERMQRAGYDGVIYGNEHEHSRYGKSAKCAIAFEPHQIEITQHHYGENRCLSPDEAKRQAVHPNQEMVPGTEDLRRRLPEVRRPDTSKPWPKTWTPSFFDGDRSQYREPRLGHPDSHPTMGVLASRQGHDTGRLWAPLPQECWDRYHGRHTGSQRRTAAVLSSVADHHEGEYKTQHPLSVVRRLDPAEWQHTKEAVVGEESAKHDAGQQDVYAVRSGNSMVNLCEHHRDVHVGNASAADALGDQLGLGGRERSAESLGGARKGSCAACNRDTAYQLKLLTPRWMQNAQDSRARRRPDKPLKTKPLPSLKQSENVRWASKGDVFHADSGTVRFDEDGREGDHKIPAGVEVHTDENQAWHKAIEHWDSGRSDFPRVYVVHKPKVEGGKLTHPAEASELEHDHTRHPELRGKYDEPDEPVLFHGTTKSDYDDDPEEITPSGGSQSFGPGIAHPGYAYATPSLSNAWDYAHKRSENGHSGRPTVYRVTPHDPDDVEKDPAYEGDIHRGNHEHDKRSKSGFAVRDEVPMSQKQGHEWRHSPFNDEAEDDDEGHYASLISLAAWEQSKVASREEPWRDIFPMAYGPEGTEPEIHGSGIKKVRHSQDMPNPLYHGSSAKFEPGDLIEPGHPGNFVRRMKHVYATESPEEAQRYGWHGLGSGSGWDKTVGNDQERHPRVYEVKPTGPYGHRSDAKGQNWASEHPWEVVREVWHHEPNESNAKKEATVNALPTLRTLAHDATENQAIRHCFTGDTRYLTAEGTKTLAETAGTLQRVLTAHQGIVHSGRWVEAIIHEFGVQPVLRVTLKRNKQTKVIRATPGHRWMVRRPDRMVQTRDLKPQHRLAHLRAPVFGGQPDHDGIRMGAVFGDGSIARRGERTYGDITLWGAKRDLVKYFDEVATSMPTERLTEGGVPGLRYQSGMAGYTKALPSLSADLGYLRGWLMGCFAMDGSVTASGQMTLSSVSLETLEHVRDVATVLGIGTYAPTSKRRRGYGTEPSLIHEMGFSATDFDESFFLRDDQRAAWRLPSQERFGWTVVSVEDHGEVETVYCPRVPETESFVLEDNIHTFQCPFCGGGKIIGRADGSVECEFCHNFFTVQIQPQYPNFPQTINGVPQQIPGMPGQVETPGAAPGMDAGGFPPGDEGEDAGGGPPWAQEAAEGATEETSEGEEDTGDEGPPPFAKKSSFRTVTGALLEEDDYVRHLAIRLAPDRDAMIASIRAERG